MLEGIVLLAFIAALAGCVFTGASVLWALAGGYLIFCAYGLIRKHSLAELGKMSLSGVKTVRNILMIFGLIGFITALWRASGTIAVIVCWSSKLVSPSAFLLIAFLLNCMVSILTGTSFGTVPIYDAVVYYHKPLREITSEEWLQIAEMHAKDGVDFLTIHVGINKNTAERFKKMKRLTNIVSRGGSIIFAWMEMTGQENPFYEHFDRLLDICQEYDVTLSLGDACRPGCLEDATDVSQLEELLTLGELTRRAWEKNVQVMIEGPGHMPLDQIAANMKIQQSVCKGAPFYVLGPLVTDVAPGYDHITAAIGGAIAASAGASFLCYVTPAEHLRLPNRDDVKEGIIASRIAAHAADLAKGIPGAKEWDRKMAQARARLDWEEQFSLGVGFPDKIHHASSVSAKALPALRDADGQDPYFCPPVPGYCHQMDLCAIKSSAGKAVL